MAAFARRSEVGVSAPGPPTPPASLCAERSTCTCTSRRTWWSAGSTTSASPAAARSSGWRVRAQVALHLDRRARGGRARRRCRGRRCWARSRSTAPVGGMNPLAVEIAAREGARVVWMPTVDAVNEASTGARAEPGAKLPAWARLAASCASEGIAIEPVAGRGRHGRVLPETRAVLAVVAAHGLVLATGHLGRDEIFAVVDAAVAGGRARHRRHSSRVSVAEPLGRGPARARGPRRAARALLHDPTHRQVLVGALARGHPRRRRRSARCCPPISARCEPAGGGRSGADGRAAAGARASPRRRCGRWPLTTRAGWRGSRREPAAARRRRARGRLRVAGRRGDRAHGGGRRRRERARALLRRARRVRASSGRRPGQTIENVKRIRHEEAERAAAALGGRLPLPRPGRLPARGRRARRSRASST